LPVSNTGLNAGLVIFWNPYPGTTGDTTFLNEAPAGGGGFSFYTSNSTTSPRSILWINSTGDISGNNFICNSTKSTLSSTTGSLIVKGGAGTAQNLNIGGNLKYYGGFHHK